MVRKSILTVVMLAIIMVGSTQAQGEMDTFVKKWTHSQQESAEKIIACWLGGASRLVISGEVISLVRTEALLASVHSARVNLYLPLLSEVSPDALPGELTAITLNERGLPFTIEALFAHREFAVLSMPEGPIGADVTELEIVQTDASGQEVKNVSEK